MTVEQVGAPRGGTGPGEPRRLLTMPEVAMILGVSAGRAYELGRRDVIPLVKLGRQVRVDRVALERFLLGEGLLR